MTSCEGLAEDFAAALGAEFAFAVGIECSYPTIAGRDGKPRRMDQMELCFHYARWREDLSLAESIGAHCLRYGPPYHRAHTGPGRYDWSFTDEVCAEMERIGAVPIMDLCHFGVPDWLENFQNPDFPRYFAEYAGAFARRYPWVRLYTPVNEIYVCAKLSALQGIWNERRTDERSFVTALKHLCRANLLAIEAIRRECPDALFVQSESAEYFHAGCRTKEVMEKAAFENERRFLSFDLLYSHPVSGRMRTYLRDSGLSDGDYDWFMSHGLGDRIITGNDFYERNEHIIQPGGRIETAGDVFGWYVITRQYWERYRRPVMHTETNKIGGGADESPRWLWKQFFNVDHLRSEGVPVLGFTWFSLIDQVDWDIALRQERGVVNPVGLFDLDRRPRVAAPAYRRMIQEFGNGLK